MRRCLSLSLLFVLLLGMTSTRAADWPTYLQGNDRVGATPEQLTTPLALRWVYSTPAPPELAWEGPRDELFEGRQMRHRVAFDRALHVAAVGDRLYFGSSVDHNIYCVDARSGKLHWSFYTDGPIRLAPTVWQGKVLVGSDDGFVYCLGADDGSLVWKLRVGPADERLLARGRMISRWPIRTGVTIDQGIAYFGAGVFPHETIYLCAADAATGKIIWRNDHISQANAGRNPLTPQGYLLTEGDQLFVPSGRSLPAAFDRKTGEQIYQKSYSWRGNAGGVVGGSKVVLADGQMYASGSHHFLAMDQKTGAVGYAFITGRQLTLSGDKGFVATGEGISAIDRASHAKATVARQKLNLEMNSLKRKRSSMKADEYQVIYSKLKSDITKLSNVGVLWSTPSDLDSALISAGDLVFAGGKGRVVALDAATGKEVWSAKVDGDASGLAVSNGCLFVSTDLGKIYGFTDAKTDSPNKTAVNHPAGRADNPFPKDDLTAMYAEAAELILKQTDVRRGFCLIVGSENGRLAYELAKRSKLRIYGIEADEKKAQASRLALDSAGLHGTRVTIVHGDANKLPFSNYFANLVVSDTLLLTGQMPGDPVEIGRCVKPCGGVLCISAPNSAPGQKTALSDANVKRITTATSLIGENKTQVSSSVATVTRGKLPGAGEWSHQYGDVANTSTSQDFRIKGGMGILWYGDPGPASMTNRHDAAHAPLSTNGRMFVQGIKSVMCYDAYNGLFLWEYANPGAIRTGVFNNEATTNLAASDDALFIAVDNTCTMLDAATGKVVNVFKTPPSQDKVPRSWGYVGHYNGLLLGTSTIRGELERARRRRGLTVNNATDAIFAIDVKTGERKWVYRGKNILHVTIAIGDDRVFFIDSSITQEQRDALLRADKTELKKLGPAEAKKKEEELKKLDVRLAVAINAKTGEQLWSKPVDVTNCSRVGIGGGELTLMYTDQHVLICGANANGHFWRQFLSGQFNERRLVVLEAETGEKLWSKDANYRHRPIIIGEEIFAEPWAFNLHTGKEKMREHPLTGEQTKWQFSRPGHHCGPITATPNTLFFRSGFTGYYDLYSDSGTSHFAGHRTGCWVNVIPGNGLVMIPEASAGCVCQFSIAATVVMEPREDRSTWRIYSADGARTPVKHMALNLGAPGDRRDNFDTLWLAYPRPHTVGRLEYVFDIKPKMAAGGRYVARNSESIQVAGAQTPWLYTSTAKGLTQCEIPLLGENDDPANYTVKLHFAEMDDNPAGNRLFDIKLQGQTVAEAVDVVKEAGGASRALVRNFAGVGVTRNLTIELVPHAKQPSDDQLPILSAIQIERE